MDRPRPKGGPSFGHPTSVVCRVHICDAERTREHWQEKLASKTHARRLMTLTEMSNVAVFVASDKATGMTGTTVNLSMGCLDD
jgi:enoyl-[acyl-carrier-protein] reductase (NADH)